MLVLKFVIRVVQRAHISYKTCSVTNIYRPIARSELVTNKIHFRCDIPIVLVKHAIKGYVDCWLTTFFVANQIAAKRFGRTKKPSSGCIYKKT